VRLLAFRCYNHRNFAPGSTSGCFQCAGKADAEAGCEGWEAFTTRTSAVLQKIRNIAQRKAGDKNGIRGQNYWNTIKVRTSIPNSVIVEPNHKRIYFLSPCATGICHFLIFATTSWINPSNVEFSSTTPLSSMSNKCLLDTLESDVNARKQSVLLFEMLQGLLVTATRRLRVAGIRRPWSIDAARVTKDDKSGVQLGSMTDLTPDVPS